MPKKNNITAITHFLFETGTLRKIVRSHRQTLLTDDLSDSISSHSFRVAVIGYFLAVEEDLDPDKVLKMCLFHDIEEARSNDLNWVHKRYVKVFEDEISESQMSFLDKDSDLKKTMKEYKTRESKESKVAKDADRLDQLLLLREYEWQGNKEASSWLRGSEHQKNLFCTTAKKIGIEIRRQKPSDWWQNLWTSKRR